MKPEVAGVVTAIVVAMIQKGTFNSAKSPDEFRKEVVKTIEEVAKAFV